jgi:acyl-CoA thioester hydrolase
MAGTTVYRTAVAPEWIDYNGHMRDAYYAVVLSLATDTLMDVLGLDAAYRERTRCTLYSLEMHMYWLHEVMASDTLEIDVHVLGVDTKRLHVGYDVRVVGRAEPAAAAEFMLLHYRQGDQPGSAPFPPEVSAAIERLRPAGGAAWAGPASRALTLAKR